VANVIKNCIKLQRLYKFYYDVVHPSDNAECKLQEKNVFLYNF